ncbi:hypothetical protein DM860_014952 [Cuscuta australis]|uniref:Tetraspanin n=1 Tax=Cuscuta australis TaxID=267555 RepID=A0A328E2H2_9ASTE|nr:hypothetical protein DM860_014952 [Cuscuta australis]
MVRFVPFLIVAAVALAIFFLIGSSLESNLDDYSPCVHIPQFSKPHTLGILLLLVGFIGLVAANSKCFPPLLVVYFAAMLAIILYLAYFVLFLYKISSIKEPGALAVNRSYMEYRLDPDDGAPGWLRGMLDHWDDAIATCLASSVPKCAQLDQAYSGPEDFFKTNLTAFESGCCKPPTPCEFTIQNATNWIAPVAPGADPDCVKWNNDPNQLCYSCDSCKAGLVVTIGKAGKDACFILVIAFLVLVGVCCFEGYALYKVNVLKSKGHELKKPQRGGQGEKE